MKFIADCHLGKIAKYLRLFGFDTLYYNHIADSEIIKIAIAENRIVLTKDRELYEILTSKRAYYVKHKKFDSQLIEIFKHLYLKPLINPMQRCLICNELLILTPKDELKNLIKDKIFKRYAEFKLCPKCNKIYWEGDHYKRMVKFVDKFINGN